MQLEKAIQNNATVLLESIMHNHDSSFRIYEQKQSTQYKQLDSFLISDDVIIDNHTYRGVRSAIRIINATMQAQHQWNDQEFDSVVEQIAEYVTQTVDNYRNTKEPGYRLYCLMFDKQSKDRICDVMVKDKKITVEFQLFHFSDYTKNAVNIVREKRLPYLNIQKNEYPDFTVYVNGIPMMNIEYKTKISTLHQGMVDFCDKKTYQCIPFYGVSNGDDFLIITNLHNYNASLKNGASDFRWVHYHDTPTKTNTEYFYEEMFIDLEHFYFYLTQCVDVDHVNKVIKNARIQQYYAMKSQAQLSHSVTLQTTKKPFNRLVVHTQRSGKTITMKMSANLWLDSGHFNKIFIFVPDLQIKDVLSKELKDNHKTVVEVATRAEFVRIIENMEKTTHKTIYLVNMQKIDEDLMKDLVYQGDDVLLIVDEAHHGQNGDQARNRLTTFPNASNLLFTATPKDATFRDYLGENAESKVLDMFTYSHAKTAGIVNNVIYQKIEREAFYDAGQLLALDFDVRYQMAVQLGCAVEDVTLDNTRVATALMDIIQQRDEFYLAKLEAIVKSFNAIRASIINETGAIAFHGKAIVYVDSIADAERYMTLIEQARLQSAEPAYHFHGLRCALDHSKADDDYSLQWNGVTKTDIDRYVQSQDSHRFDLLFAVDKYQKGYDLKELVAVYLDKNISEPSLINQIYTRPATKRADKSVGYCIDLHNNDKVLQASFDLYDQDRAGILSVFDEAQIHGLEKELDEAKKALETTMTLSDGYTSYDILEKLLNEPSLPTRATYQQLFFVKITHLIARVSQVESPLYFKEQRYFLNVLRKTVEALFACLNNSDPRILYRYETPDNSTTVQVMSREDMLQKVQLALTNIAQSDVFKVIHIQYKTPVDYEHTDTKTIGDLHKKIREEQRLDALQQFAHGDGFAFHQNMDLKTAIERLLAKVTASPGLVHNCDIQNDIIAIQDTIDAQRKEEEERVHNEFNHDYLWYAMTMMLEHRAGNAYAFKEEMRPLAEKLNATILHYYPHHRAVSDITMVWNKFEQQEQPAHIRMYVKESTLLAAEDGHILKPIWDDYSLQQLCEDAMAYIQP